MRKLWLLALVPLVIWGSKDYLWHTSNKVVATKVNKLELATMPPLPSLQVGDVTLRMGVGADSYIIASTANSNYSHVGVISSISPDILITHASTEDDPPANFNGVSTIALQDFIAQGQRIAIVRYRSFSAQEQEQIANFLHSKEGQAFVLSNDPEALYCTTLAIRALEPYVNLALKSQKLNIPLLTGDYYMPQAFLDDAQAHCIYEYPKKEDLHLHH